MRPNLSLAAVLVLVSCGPTTTGTPPPEYAAMPRTTTETTEPVLGPLRDLNRRAREAGELTETLHGVEVADPYRALESESALTTEWIEVQTARTAAAIAEWSNAAMRERLDGLLHIGTIGGAAIAGDRVLLSRREGEREQPAIYVRGLTADSPERLLLDPLTYGERAALDWMFLSPSGDRLAFGISTNGDERSTLRVMNVTTGELLPDTIEHCKWSDVAWLHDESGFYYRRYPREGEADHSAEEPDSYHIRLFFHRLGDDPANDVLVFDPPEATDFPAARVSDDDRWLTINVFRGWSQSDVFLLDRGARARDRVAAPDATHTLVTVTAGEDHLYDGHVHHGLLYMLTNEGAPRYQLVSIDPSRPTDPAARTVVVPEGTGTIDGWAIAGSRLVLHVIDDVRSRLVVVGLDGTAQGEIELPGRGSVSALSSDMETGRVLFDFSSYVHAPSVRLWTPPRGRRAPTWTTTTIAEVDVPVDLGALEVSQASVPSEDGTEINVYYVHRRGLVLDGTAPVLLNAYGGFNVSLLPGFQRNPLYWVDRGGIFAVANLRGGSERGEDWHRDGAMENKEHVFEDMEAVIRWLGGASGLSRPDRIAITGGSNGGLLMGAMLTRCPDAFGAAASYVGLYDMIRYHHFPPAELWVTEYGSSDDATQFGWLRAYSPYHHVSAPSTPGHYPSVLIETADHDTRVFWGHSTKFAALLQEVTAEEDPRIWFYRERDVGHGAGTPVSSLVNRYVRMYSFVEHALGVEPYRRPEPAPTTP